MTPDLRATPIVADDVRFRYHHITGVDVLNGISLSLRSGGWTAIMGTSGSGKSTFLRCCAGLLSPSSGRVLYLDQDVSHLTDRQSARLRRRDFGFIFQDYNLLESLTVVQNVEVPLLLEKVRESRPRALEALAQVGLKDVAHRRATELSGGQQQRVAIARALAQRPAVVFADEPTGALDSRSSAKIMQLFETLRAQDRTILMVTHDPAVAARADTVLFLKDGQVASSLEGASAAQIGAALLLLDAL